MTEGIDIRLFRVSFFFYLIASIIFISCFFNRGNFSRGNRLSLLGVFIHCSALVIHGVGLAIRWDACKCFPLVLTYDYLVALGFVVGLFFTAYLIRYRAVWMGIVFSSIPLIFLFFASLIPVKVIQQFDPILRSGWFYLHTSVALISEAFFAVGAGGSMIYLIKLDGGILPRRELLEEVILGAVRWGYLMFTAGALIAGSIWTYHSRGVFWSWDSREVESLIIWLFYTLILHRLEHGKLGGRAMAISFLSAFSLWVFFLLRGLRSYV